MLTLEALEHAIERIRAFWMVQEGTGDFTSQFLALRTMEESLGLSDEIMLRFARWIVEEGEETWHGPSILLGLILGLFAHEYTNP